MYKLLIGRYKKSNFIADNHGNVIIKNLRSDQISDVNKYERKRVKKMGLK